ncbi:MAG TPA: AAA family ATPase [Vicinamibacterales bacterium]|nr:AAA family ATPase [Vicinamibacterales bacterium]
MARLSGTILSDDESFKAQLATMLRTSSVPVIVGDDRRGASPDVAIVDGRGDLAAAVALVERLRTADATTGIFFVAASSNPDAILQSMRAGANEFFTWPPAKDVLDEGVTRTAGRRATSAPPQATTMVFFGAKGGAGTTTMAVNSAVEISRLSKRPTVIVDLKPGLGEVSLFLGVRSRYTLLDALDNLHRLDSDFLRELVVKHKSGLEMLAGSDLFDRPGPGDSSALEEVFRLLGRQYEYIVIDAGSQMNPCSVSALYTADMIGLVANPDVPCVRNAQRLLDRIGQLGPCAERVKILLNRAAEPYPIPPAQLQSALGQPIFHTFPSDYKAVSSALNSGVPLALSGNTEMATQFDKFIRRIIDTGAEGDSAAGERRGALGINRLASIW